MSSDTKGGKDDESKSICKANMWKM